MNLMNGNHSHRSVCIIGAGVAGLCALRHFSARADHFDPLVCYEQTDLIGGTWNYTDAVGSDKNGLPVLTSMYQNLRTNAPSQVMEYPDFPGHYSKSYPDSAEVLEYIHDYARHFHLQQFIRFEHHLKHVTREPISNTWQLTILDIRADRTFVRNFDILILCPGRSCIPLWPQIASLGQFKGRVMHAHDYRSRLPFTGQRVALLGAGPSGFDLSQQLSTVAKKVIFINRTAVQFEKLPENVRQVRGEIEGFTADAVTIRLLDESGKSERFEIDSIIMCTGYGIHLGYLDQEACGLRLNPNDTLDGIYRNMINIKYPTMLLLSIMLPSINFPLYHQQLLYYIKLISGEIRMPSAAEMEAEVEEDIRRRKEAGLLDSKRHLHRVDLMRDYFRLLERDARLEPTPGVMFDLLKTVAETRRRNPSGYKEINYRLVDANTFEIV